MSAAFSVLWPLTWLALATTYFCMERGSIEFHDAELLQEKKFTCDVFPFFYSHHPPTPTPTQLMPFPWFPLWCCICPTLGHSAGRGDTPKYINSLTRCETH